MSLTSVVVSSANISILLLVVVGMMAVYNVYNIFPKTLPCGTPALASLTLEYASEVKVEEGAHEKYS